MVGSISAARTLMGGTKAPRTLGPTAAFTKLAQIGSGQALIKLPDNASATVAVGRGNITMSIPAGAWNLATEAADVIVDPAISVSPSAPGRIELIAPAGEVKVLPPEALAKATR